jgi:hypothetical protein
MTTKTPLASGKKKKSAQKLAWRSFTKEEYRQTAVEMVHFSAKTVNSNTLPFGIRLGIDIKLNLPYVAASTMNRLSIPMDYIVCSNTKGSGKSIRMKQINAARSGVFDEFESIPPQTEVDTILDACSILNSDYESEDSVGIRLRQIILQDMDGNDIAATPLPCAGLSSLINKRIDEEFNFENPLDNKGVRKNEKHFIRRKRAYLGIGGTNPQNVGLNVRSIQKPLIFKIPAMSNRSRQLKQAFSAYHKGIEIKPDITILTEFIIWQRRLLNSYFDIQPSNMDIHNKNVEFLTAMTSEFMARAAIIEKLLRDNIEKLPDQQICSSNLSFRDQCLLNSSLRTMEWRREFADYFHTQIISEYVWIEKKKVSLERGKHETAHWIGIIEEALQ